MELYQLKTFVAVSKEGNLTRAAERLHTSQPSVSAHIKALEEELGVVLFVRTPKGMQLTPQGLLLQQKADQVLQAAEAMRFAADQFKDEVIGEVRLGLNTDPVYLQAARILAELKRDHPQVSLSYIPRMTWEAPADLHAEKLDAAFAYARPEDDDAIAAHTLDRVKLHIVGPVAWQDRLQDARLIDLTTYPWIWTSHHCPFFSVAQGLFEELAREPIKAVITDQEAAIRQMVAAGVGLSIMIEREALDAVAQGEAFIVGPSVAELDLSLLYLKRRAHDPLIQAILTSIARAWQAGDDLKVGRLGDALKI